MTHGSPLLSGCGVGIEGMAVAGLCGRRHSLPGVVLKAPPSTFPQKPENAGWLTHQAQAAEVRKRINKPTPRKQPKSLRFRNLSGGHGGANSGSGNFKGANLVNITVGNMQLL
jgi:hypothetical protein